MSNSIRKNSQLNSSKVESSDDSTLAATKGDNQSTPDVYDYINHLTFLQNWFSYLKKTRKGFSLRKLAKDRQLASGLLPMVLAGKRPLSLDALKKIMPALYLNPSEQNYLLEIHALNTSQTQEDRIAALEKMKRFAKYRSRNPDEAESFQYLSQWYYYTIRELSAAMDFSLDPLWIQSKLRNHVPLNEIKTAIDFLIKHRYIEKTEDGTIKPPQKTISCQGEIYKVALTQYHRQLFNLAEKSIDNAESNERYLLGHTFAIPSAQYEQVKQLIDEVRQKIVTIAENVAPKSIDSVYHIELALFPLTKKTEE